MFKNKDSISRIAIKLIYKHDKFMNESVSNPDNKRANEVDALQVVNTDYKTLLFVPKKNYLYYHCTIEALF